MLFSAYRNAHNMPGGTAWIVEEGVRVMEHLFELREKEQKASDRAGSSLFLDGISERSMRTAANRLRRHYYRFAHEAAGKTAAKRAK